jgi:hypothetical protein
MIGAIARLAAGDEQHGEVGHRPCVVLSGTAQLIVDDALGPRELCRHVQVPAKLRVAVPEAAGLPEHADDQPLKQVV